MSDQTDSAYIVNALKERGISVGICKMECITPVNNFKCETCCPLFYKEAHRIDKRDSIHGLMTII